MRKFVFLSLTILLAAKVVAQGEPLNYNATLNKFKQFYNGNQPDSIFSMFSPELKEQLPLDKFTTTTIQLKNQLGALVKTGFKKYDAPVAQYDATFKNAMFQLNLALNNRDQITGLRLLPVEDKTIPAIPVDPSVTESDISIKTMSGTIYGTLTMPNNASGKIPVVLIISGSGQTDRNGNNPTMGISANTYKLLSYALGKNGYASVRYDKRLVGQSGAGTKEDDLRFEDNVDDAVGFIEQLSSDDRFSKIVIAGHSEGSLVGMMAAIGQPVKGFISLEGAGVRADKLMTEQMKSKPEYLSQGFTRMLDTLRRGHIFKDVDPALYPIARPSIQNYLMSWCRYDPSNEFHKLKIPILIIQGTIDQQVTVDNGQKLKAAKSAAVLTIIRGMNYVLKDGPVDKDQNLATYKDATLPLNTEMVTAVNDFIKGL